MRRRAREQLLIIYKISYLCPRDERESQEKLKTSPGIHKILFTTQ